MFGETTIFYIKIWNHPIETTIYKWLFGVPGISVNLELQIFTPASIHSTNHQCLTSLQIGDQVRPHQHLGQPKRPGHKENEMSVEVVRIKAYQDDTTTATGSTPPKIKIGTWKWWGPSWESPRDKGSVFQVNHVKFSGLQLATIASETLRHFFTADKADNFLWRKTWEHPQSSPLLFNLLALSRELCLRRCFLTKTKVMSSA